MYCFIQTVSSIRQVRKRKGWSMQYNYLIRRKVLSLFGAQFHIYNPQQQLIGYCKQKAFKLKEDIRIYSDETQSCEILHIQARNIIDFSACYDVIDSQTGMVLGAWRRKGFTSLIRDNWELLDVAGNVIGQLKEDSLGLALIRRLVCGLIPQKYDLVNMNGIQVRYSQCFNPFVFKLGVSINPVFSIHPYLILAGGILLAAIEGRQNN